MLSRNLLKEKTVKTRSTPFGHRTALLVLESPRGLEEIFSEVPEFLFVYEMNVVFKNTVSTD